MQAVGTFSWIVHGMDTFGFDILNGIDVVGTTYASKTAVELALRGGEADVIVDDFLGPVLLRANGVDVPRRSSRTPPPSAASSSAWTPTSPARRPARRDHRREQPRRQEPDHPARAHDLAVRLRRAERRRGARRLAAPDVAADRQRRSRRGAAALALGRPHGGRRDRARAHDGRRHARHARPPDRPAEPGRRGPRRLDDDLKTKFIAALVETVEYMRSLPNDDPFWQSILDEELYSLPNEAQFPAVVDRWRLGTVTNWTDAQIEGLVAMVDRLVEIAGAEVVGVDSVPADAYSTAFVPR
jgi:NitT/TauT family transport system substrate-binding protein